jgi:hypothetical protein
MKFSSWLSSNSVINCFKRRSNFERDFQLRLRFAKRFLKSSRFFFRMICWSAVEFITYETLFRSANWKSFARSRINKKFTIVTIIVEFAMILSVDKVVIMNMITIDDVDVLKIRVIFFIDWFVIDDAIIKKIDQIWEFRRWIM